MSNLSNLSNQEISQGEPKTRLPIWAKLSLFIFLVCLALSVGGLVFGAAWMANMAEVTQNPSFIASVMKRIARIDALPDGFVYDSAAA